MNWDQIEQKWEEMTRRVQQPSSLPVKIREALSQNGPGIVAPDPVTASGLIGRMIDAKSEA